MKKEIEYYDKAKKYIKSIKISDKKSEDIFKSKLKNTSLSKDELDNRGKFQRRRSELD